MTSKTAEEIAKSRWEESVDQFAFHRMLLQDVDPALFRRQWLAARLQVEALLPTLEDCYRGSDDTKNIQDMLEEIRYTAIDLYSDLNEKKLLARIDAPFDSEKSHIHLRKLVERMYRTGDAIENQEGHLPNSLLFRKELFVAAFRVGNAHPERNAENIVESLLGGYAKQRENIDRLFFETKGKFSKEKVIDIHIMTIGIIGQLQEKNIPEDAIQKNIENWMQMREGETFLDVRGRMQNILFLLRELDGENPKVQQEILHGMQGLLEKQKRVEDFLEEEVNPFLFPDSGAVDVFHFLQKEYPIITPEGEISESALWDMKRQVLPAFALGKEDQEEDDIYLSALQISGKLRSISMGDMLPQEMIGEIAEKMAASAFLVGKAMDTYSSLGKLNKDLVSHQMFNRFRSLVLPELEKSAAKNGQQIFFEHAKKHGIKAMVDRVLELASGDRLQVDSSSPVREKALLGSLAIAVTEDLGKIQDEFARKNCFPILGADTKKVLQKVTEIAQKELHEAQEIGKSSSVEL